MTTWLAGGQALVATGTAAVLVIHASVRCTTRYEMRASTRADMSAKGPITAAGRPDTRRAGAPTADQKPMNSPS
jgi:hypothetical protein